MKISDINHYEQLYKISEYRDFFIIMNSSVTSMMGIRKNNDLDILVTKNFNCKKNIPGISINTWNRWEKRLSFLAKNAEEFILKHSILVEGFNVCKPRIHLEILKARVDQNSGGQKTVEDLKKVSDFLRQK